MRYFLTICLAMRFLVFSFTDIVLLSLDEGESSVLRLYRSSLMIAGGYWSSDSGRVGDSEQEFMRHFFSFEPLLF